MGNPLRWLRQKLRRRLKRRYGKNSSLESQVVEALVDDDDSDFSDAREHARELDDATDAGEPSERPILGDWQRERAKIARNGLNTVDSASFSLLLSGAMSTDEEDYLHKALAAGRTVAEIEAFAARIQGKDSAWLREHLTLTGSSSGGGMRQQFDNSCGVTTVQALRGEIDPIYALKMRDENPDMDKVDADPNKYNPRLAAEQRAMLEHPYYGSRPDGWGTVSPAHPLVDDGVDSAARHEIDDLLNMLAPSTGLRYVPMEVGYDIEVGPVLDDIEIRLRKGLPVPISVGDEETCGHALLLIGLTSDTPPNFLIYEPTDGIVVTRTRTQFENGELDIGIEGVFTSVDLPFSYE